MADQYPLRYFEIETVFLSPARVPEAVEALAAASLTWVPNADVVDPAGPTVYGVITGLTSENQDAIYSLAQEIVDPFDGDCVQWSFQDAPSTHAKRTERWNG